MRVLTCTQTPPNHHINTVCLPFVHFVRLPLHGSLLARLALLAQFVGFRPPHYCSSLLPYRHHEAIKENGRNKNGNPGPGTKEHPVARSNGQTAKRSSGSRRSSNDAQNEALKSFQETIASVVVPLSQRPPTAVHLPEKDPKFQDWDGDRLHLLLWLHQVDEI